MVVVVVVIVVVVVVVEVVKAGKRLNNLRFLCHALRYGETKLNIQFLLFPSPVNHVRRKINKVKEGGGGD